MSQEDKIILRLLAEKLLECSNLYDKLSEETKTYILYNNTNESLRGFGLFKSDIQDLAWEGKIIK